MTKIPNLNEEDLFLVIDKVAKNHQNKTFDYHIPDDIYQKVWEICLEKLPLFEYDRGLYKDPLKCLEHWLNTVVARRLSNYKRDTFDVKQKARKSDVSAYEKEVRKSLAYPTELNSITENFAGQEDENILYREYLLFVIKSLDDKEITLLDSLLSGENIPSYYKTQLLKKMKDLYNAWQAI